MSALALLWLALEGATCLVGDRLACPRRQFCAAVFDGATAQCPTLGTCTPLPDAPALTLSLPVPAGDRVFCIHGILASGNDTHSTCSEDRRFALDLASTAYEAPHLVLASADGTAYPWGDCPTTDLNHAPPDGACNLGLGNVVRVQHAGGLFTQYAHLSAIMVLAGQSVKRGQPLGIEGNTGAAGPKHLHFSLHRGDAAQLLPAPSLPIRRLRLQGGRFVDQLALRCGQYDADGTPAASTAYLSDNRRIRSASLIGLMPAPRLALEYAVGKIFDPATRALAIRVLRESPTEPLARYWLAVALELDGNRDGARVLFRALAADQVGPSWIRRWSWLRLADIAANQNNVAEARAALTQATTGAAPSDVDFLRFADWVRREVESLERTALR